MLAPEDVITYSQLPPQLTSLHKLRSVTCVPVPNPYALNALSSSPALSSLRSISFRASTHRIVDPHIESLLKFQSLTSLSLQCNISQKMFQRICTEMGKLLEVLDVRGSSFLTSLVPLSLCSRLKTLSISSCQRLTGDELQHLTHLEQMVCSFCPFACCLLSSCFNLSFLRSLSPCLSMPFHHCSASFSFYLHSGHLTSATHL